MANEIYHLRVKLYDGIAHWGYPRIPRSNSDIEKLREDAVSLCYLYEKVAIFCNQKLVEEIQ